MRGGQGLRFHTELSEWLLMIHSLMRAICLSSAVYFSYQFCTSQLSLSLPLSSLLNTEIPAVTVSSLYNYTVMVLNTVTKFNLDPILIFRAIYFAAYSNCKETLNNIFEPDSTKVHMTSAGVAGKDL